MLSFKLWRALNHPPRNHPLFSFVLARANRDEFKITSGFFMWLFMCSMLTFFWTIVFDWLLYVFLGLFVLCNTFYALRWALRISETISSEKEQRRYDLLASLPFGMLGTSWAISTGCVHRRSSFRRVPYIIQVSVIVVAMTIVFNIGVTLLAMSNGGTEDLRLANRDLLYVSMSILPFLIVFYVDHLYSLVTAILFGMLASLDVRMPIEAKVRALLGFLTMQVVIYTLSVLVAVWGLPQIFAYIGLGGLWAIAVDALISIAIFLILREALVRRMWQYITRALNAEETDVALVLQSARA